MPNYQYAIFDSNIGAVSGAVGEVNLVLNIIPAEYNVKLVFFFCIFHISNQEPNPMKKSFQASLLLSVVLVIIASHGNAQDIITTCPDDTSQYVSPGECNGIVSYTVEYLAGATITYQFTGATTGNGNGTGSPGIFNSGITNVYIYAILAGNPNDTCFFTVTVIDDQSPVIYCPNDTSFIAAPPECILPNVILTLPIYFDNCPDPLLTWQMTGATTGSGTDYYQPYLVVNYIIKHD